MGSGPQGCSSYIEDETNTRTSGHHGIAGFSSALSFLHFPTKVTFRLGLPPQHTVTCRSVGRLIVFLATQDYEPVLSFFRPLFLHCLSCLRCTQIHITVILSPIAYAHRRVERFPSPSIPHTSLSWRVFCLFAFFVTSVSLLRVDPVASGYSGCCVPNLISDVDFEISDFGRDINEFQSKEVRDCTR